MFENSGTLTTDGLLGSLYDDLESLASRYLSRETSDRSMEPAELVHESFLRLSGHTRAPWQNQAHFMAVSAQIMRHILIDHARAKYRRKRGGRNRVREELQEYHAVCNDEPIAELLFQEFMDRLAVEEPVSAQVLHLRVFQGFPLGEIAKMLGVSIRTIERRWETLRSWTLQS